MGSRSWEVIGSLLNGPFKFVLVNIVDEVIGEVIIGVLLELHMEAKSLSTFLILNECLVSGEDGRLVCETGEEELISAILCFIFYFVIF